MPEILSSLSRWLRKKKSKLMSGSISDPRSASRTIKKTPPLPALPSERPRALTPTPSREDLTLSAIANTETSPFFQRLPYEIRRRILIEAFGGHIVHMDLSFNHPEIPQPEGQRDYHGRQWWSHCNKYKQRPRNPDVSGMSQLDTTTPPRWIWRGSECHRSGPSQTVAKNGLRVADAGLNVAEDRCRMGGGERELCRKWRGDDYTKCFVGAMGWLLSCRQAYCEGIDVLYRTNTIHTASKEMVMNLDTLLLSQRLSGIRSMEIVWDFGSRSRQDTGPIQGLDLFYQFLAKLPNLFPNIRSLVVCLQGTMLSIRRDNQLQHFERLIMVPVDTMIGRLGAQFRECTIAITADIYPLLRGGAIEAGEKVEQIHLGAERERHWRPLEGDASSLEGYWVQLGERSWRRQYICTMGEGLPEGFYPQEDEVFYLPWYIEEYL